MVQGLQIASCEEEVDVQDLQAQVDRTLRAQEAAEARLAELEKCEASRTSQVGSCFLLRGGWVGGILAISTQSKTSTETM